LHRPQFQIKQPTLEIHTQYGRNSKFYYHFVWPPLASITLCINLQRIEAIKSTIGVINLSFIFPLL
jgi:hypothetical protein